MLPFLGCGLRHNDDSKATITIVSMAMLVMLSISSLNLSCPTIGLTIGS